LYVQIVALRAAKGEIDKLSRRMVEHVEATRINEGLPGKCLSYFLGQDEHDPDQLFTIEVYIDEEAHEEHRASAHVAAVRRDIMHIVAGDPVRHELKLLAGFGVMDSAVIAP